IPIILVGTGGIWVMYVSNAKGHFEAKGDQWNTIDNNGRGQPAAINLIGRVVQLTNAFQKYLKMQKIDMPNPVESVLIAADPGAQVESVRPAARVVRSDAIKQFANSLVQARPVWRTDQIYNLADRIVEPRPPSELTPAAPPPAEPAARAKASLDASEESASFDANTLGFGFEDEAQPAQPAQPSLHESSPAQPLPSPTPAPQKKKNRGMTRMQTILLVGMTLMECCILAGFGALMYYSF
ncbi:MAG: hypothetical protein HYZ23_01835, partial [Chloroflexi bacterium]|nr:hypothetical protein [Chloroflexota bacterium]